MTEVHELFLLSFAHPATFQIQFSEAVALFAHAHCACHTSQLGGLTVPFDWTFLSNSS